MEIFIGFLILGFIALYYFYIKPSKHHHHTRNNYRSSPSETPTYKGVSGEKSVAITLSKYKKSKYHLINDLMIEFDGKNSQIDHVLITNYGVFVIETKNYSGIIFGEENQREWLQVLYSEKNNFYNPLKQNKTHIYALSHYLNKYNCFFSFIVFIDSNIDNIDISNVCNLEDLMSNIYKIDDVILTDKEIEEIYDRLINLKIYPSTTTEEHINEIHKMQEDIDNNICPRCKGTLVLRKGKYGEFYGCSNYPNCRFKKEKKPNVL
ncbi:MAG: NERD domain-containing protein [Acholeplasmatales bacterium]|jgi:hypothetical protein|nr:NERD domain-containing protein [Acholeplasmatales bacterium]